jgi:hypothetical protein
MSMVNYFLKIFEHLLRFSSLHHFNQGNFTNQCNWSMVKGSPAYFVLYTGTKFQSFKQKKVGPACL